jgi:hypothetical protein
VPSPFVGAWVNTHLDGLLCNVIPARRTYISTPEIQKMSPAERKEKAELETQKWAEEIGTEEAIKVCVDPSGGNHISFDLEVVGRGDGHVFVRQPNVGGGRYNYHQRMLYQVAESGLTLARALWYVCWVDNLALSRSTPQEPASSVQLSQRPGCGTFNARLSTQQTYHRLWREPCGMFAG